MIIKNGEQIELKFGTGDICVASTLCTDNENKEYGLITFSNQEAREIGADGDVKAGQEYIISEFPVIMTFSKKESIDVVVRRLLLVRDSMS